ncbi:hypothetical protein [Delftia acidovorans]
MECQSYRLTYETPPPVRYAARHIANVQQRYTQRGGVRPFGVGAILGGFGADGTPELYLTTPQGTFSKWFACTIGRRADVVEEYLLEHYPKPEGLAADDPIADYVVALPDQEAALKLAITSLFQVVDALSTPVAVVVVRPKTLPIRIPPDLLDQLLRAADSGA